MINGMISLPRKPSLTESFIESGVSSEAIIKANGLNITSLLLVIKHFKELQFFFYFYTCSK